MKLAGLLLAIVFLVPGIAAQTNCEEGSGPLTKATPPAIAQEEIIQKFAANEAKFKQTQLSYSFTQDLTVQTLQDPLVLRGTRPRRTGAPQVTGEFRETMVITYDSQGRRLENVNYAPQSTLRDVSLTREDMDDFRTIAAPMLTPDDLAEYDIHYMGQQRLDEIDAYAFNVVPKHAKKERRLFEGNVWVDTRDLVIVKTCGKRVPDQRDKQQENLSPRFVVYREQIDGQYWFPTYARADDILHFKTGAIHIREIIKYTNYKRAGNGAPSKDGSHAAESPDKHPK
jgi:hypothetical protein